MNVAIKDVLMPFVILTAFVRGLPVMGGDGSEVSGPDCSGNSVSPATDSVVVDIDGNVYHTVAIGNQVWFVENLKVTHYRDGREIPNVIDDAVWSNLKTGALCWYDHDSSYKDIYGGLYNFYAVMDSCGVCPDSWHVPTESEWLELVTYLGGEEVAGGKMKQTGTTLWSSPNVGATNESGFDGIPAGGRGQISGTGEGGNYATWWSSTAFDPAFAWHWGLYHGNARVRFNPGHMASGFSIRCVKD